MNKKSQNNKNKFNPIKNIGGNIIVWILIIAMSITALQILSSDKNNKEISLTKYEELLGNGSIKSGTVTGNKTEGWVFEGELKEPDIIDESTNESYVFFTINFSFFCTI